MQRRGNPNQGKPKLKPKKAANGQYRLRPLLPQGNLLSHPSNVDS